MTNQRRRPPQHIGELLPVLAVRLGLEDELLAARAMSSWQRVVEEQAPAAAGASRLVEIRPPALIVSAADAATGQELRLHSAQLLEAFAAAPGGTRLLELKVVVRPPVQGPSGKPL
jgi:predicted nucleic acid-binding Zn ribbon protein